MLGAVLVAAAAGALASRACAAGRFDAALSSITQEDLVRHVSFLASDSLEGREAGTRGGHAAAAYLVDRLKAFGVQPAAEDGGFVQEFGAGYRNVLGLVRGSDPQLSQEYILVGGHLDHVGYGTRVNSNGGLGRIHNGADDNASGVAAILELVQALQTLPQPLSRSVLIAFWDGEEKGLLGSKYWARHPTVPLDRVRLALNLDMVGRMSDDAITAYGTRTCCGLRECLTRANEAAQLRVRFDLNHRDDSDHYTFYEKEIPYLMLFTGEHPDYHRPSDDVNRINFPGLQQISRIVLNVVAETAENGALGRFRKECRQETSSRDIALKPCPPRLGISWAKDWMPGQPIPIVRVDSGTPAAAAGVRVGDMIERVEGIPAGEVSDLRNVVACCPGDLTLELRRTGHDEPIVSIVKLAGCAVPPGSDVRRDLSDVDALLVVNVEPSSPAGKAGFRSGDRIVPSRSDADAPGAKPSWTIEREGRMQRVTVE